MKNCFDHKLWLITQAFIKKNLLWLRFQRQNKFWNQLQVSLRSAIESQSWSRIKRSKTCKNRSIMMFGCSSNQPWKRRGFKSELSSSIKSRVRALCKLPKTLLVFGNATLWKLLWDTMSWHKVLNPKILSIYRRNYSKRSMSRSSW